MESKNKMSTNKKNIKEMSSAAGSGMQGPAVTVKNAFRKSYKLCRYWSERRREISCGWTKN